MWNHNKNLFSVLILIWFCFTFYTGHILQGKVFVKLQLNCQSPIEFGYYSSGIGKADICCYCTAQGIQQDKELKKQFRVVLPVCQACLDDNKPVLKRNPIRKWTDCYKHMYIPFLCLLEGSDNYRETCIWTLTFSKF